MAVYTVHAPPLPDRGSVQPEQFIFVRDGFSFPALLFGGLWMLRHRMWLVLLGYVLVTVALAIATRLTGSAGGAAVVWVLVALLTGFEASTLRRFTLARRGYRTVGLVVGDHLDIAERRFFDAWVQKEAAGDPFDAWGQKNSGQKILGHKTGAPGAPPAPAHGPDVLGLFPEPGAT